MKDDVAADVADDSWEPTRGKDGKIQVGVNHNDTNFGRYQFDTVDLPRYIELHKKGALDFQDPDKHKSRPSHLPTLECAEAELKKESGVVIAPPKPDLVEPEPAPRRPNPVRKPKPPAPAPTPPTEGAEGDSETESDDLLIRAEYQRVAVILPQRTPEAFGVALRLDPSIVRKFFGDNPVFARSLEVVEAPKPLPAPPKPPVIKRAKAKVKKPKPKPQRALAKKPVEKRTRARPKRRKMSHDEQQFHNLKSQLVAKIKATLAKIKRG